MLSVAAFRQQIAMQGEQFEWLKASPCSCYDPAQNYDAQGSCEVCDHGWVYRSQGVRRGLVSALKRSMLHPDLGWVQSSELTLTTMPDEVLFGFMDKVVLLERTVLERVRLHRGSDTLHHSYVVIVREISDAAGVYKPGTDYTVNLATGRVTWITDGPQNVYAVEYLRRPVYWHIGLDVRPPRPTGQSVQTPQRGLLSLAPPPG